MICWKDDGLPNLFESCLDPQKKLFRTCSARVLIYSRCFGTPAIFFLKQTLKVLKTWASCTNWLRKPSVSAACKANKMVHFLDNAKRLHLKRILWHKIGTALHGNACMDSHFEWKRARFSEFYFVTVYNSKSFIVLHDSTLQDKRKWGISTSEWETHHEKSLWLKVSIW